jgi:5'-nucleotidase / UDP-sugar diphosphatase
MKRQMIWLGVVIMLLLSPQVYAQTDTLTILHLNDTHSHLLPYGPKDAGGNWTWGGYARIATLVGMTRMTEPNVMLLHGGDFFVGDFMFQEYVGVAELEILKALNCDALEVGNHEFDLYPSTFKYVLDQAGFPNQGFPLLCANLDFSGDNDFPPLNYFVQPYTIKEIGGVRVGIFGLLTDLTNQISNASPIVVTSPMNVAQAWVDSLRIGHDCDVVILLSHMGIEYDQMAASTVSGIDVIVGGHSHTEIDQPIEIGNTLLVQADAFGRWLGKLQLYVDNGVVNGWNYDLMSVDSSVPEEPNLAATINYLAAGIEADPRFGPVYTNVIAHANRDITKPLGAGAVKDTPLGNLTADALRGQTGTDIAFQPQGFISNTIYAGNIKGADIFQALPYGFDQTSGFGLKLVTFNTNGMSIMAGLEFAVYNMPYGEDFFLQGSNISYVYNLSAPAGARIDYSAITINGEPLNPTRTYSVTAPDAVVPFLTQIPGFTITDLIQTDYFVYSVARDYIVAHSPVSYYAEGRVLDVSSFGEPLTGVNALSDVVTLFNDNGSIRRPMVNRILHQQLELVEYCIEHNRMRAAVAGICVFKTEVNIANRLRQISPFSAQKLTYLANKLQAVCGSPFHKEEIDESLPVAFDLSQNYPNPFNPQTEISYSLPYDSDVNLRVFNILGEEVRELVNTRESAGNHSIIWDGRNNDGSQVASGTYFYKLQAGEFSDTKKMSLMK